MAEEGAADVPPDAPQLQQADEALWELAHGGSSDEDNDDNDGDWEDGDEGAWLGVGGGVWVVEEDEDEDEDGEYDEEDVEMDSDEEDVERRAEQYLQVMANENNVDGGGGEGATFTMDTEPTEYSMPCGRHHDQVADSVTSCLGRPGEVLVLDQRARVTELSIVRMDPVARGGTPAEVEGVTSGEYQLLANTDLPYHPFSISWSTCGTRLAACGSGGVFSLYTVQDTPSRGSSEESEAAAPAVMHRVALGIIPGRESSEAAGNAFLLRRALRHNMNNSVRFGKLWGKETVIIALQTSVDTGDPEDPEAPNNFAYILNFPSNHQPDPALASTIACLPPAAYLLLAEESRGAACASRLKEGTVVKVHTKPVEVMPLSAPRRDDNSVKTAALGPFPVELNCVTASPDGRWVAAVGDALELFLVRMGQGSREWCVEECITVYLDSENEPCHHRTDPGAQYVAWNRCSTMVAVTTDSTCRTFVVSVPSGTLVGACHLRPHLRPCMPVAWSPFDDYMMAYAEDWDRVHVMDVRASTEQDSNRGCQTLRLHNAPQEEIMGLCWGGDPLQPELVVATALKLLKWEMLGCAWTSESHRLYPQRFKDAVVCLLTAALTNKTTGEPLHANGFSEGFWSLPKEVLMSIMAEAARVPGDWMG